jgi:hypothetical protein
MLRVKTRHDVLGGVMIIILATDPRFAGSNPAESDGLLKGDKIHTMTSF